MNTGTKRLLGTAAMAAGLALAQPAGAAVISYVEGPSASPQDLSDNVSAPTLVGALGLGLNTITGSIACSSFLCGSGDRLDAFSVTLASGLRMTGIAIRISAYQATGGNPDQGGSFGTPGQGSLLAQVGGISRDFAADLGPTSVFTGAADGPGDLSLSVAWAAFNSFSDITRSATYEVGITVEAIPTMTPVPEPASVALLGAGLLGLGLVRRRRA